MFSICSPSKPEICSGSHLGNTEETGGFILRGGVISFRCHYNSMMKKILLIHIQVILWRNFKGSHDFFSRCGVRENEMLFFD